MNTVLAILGMGVCAFLPRFLPFVVLGDKPLPPRLQGLLAFVPPAILAAIVVPALTMPGAGGAIELGIHNRFLVAGIVALVIGAVWKRPLTACAVASSMFFAWPWVLR